MMSNILGNKIHASIYLVANFLLHISSGVVLWNLARNTTNTFWPIAVIGLYLIKSMALYFFQLSEEQERLEQMERLVAMLKSKENETDDNLLFLRKDD